MEEKILTVKIIKSTDRAYWYSDLIGKKYQVRQCSIATDKYETVIKNYRCIDKSDCKIISNKHSMFFLIWTSATGYAKYRHTTYESAETEIKRLHKLEPKKTFYILKAVAKMSKNRKKEKRI